MYSIDNQGRVLIPVAALIKHNVISKSAYDAAKYRGAFKTNVRGGNGHPVFVIYETMTPRYKRKVCAAFGDPYVVLKRKRERSYYLSNRRLISILTDIAQIEDDELRISLTNKLLNL